VFEKLVLNLNVTAELSAFAELSAKIKNIRRGFDAHRSPADCGEMS
jgi:hypothetical protein